MSRVRVDLLSVESRHTWDREGWFPPLSRALAGVTADQAGWRPLGGGNSIWSTLHHLNFYNERYLRRFTGQEPGPAAATNTATFDVEYGPHADAAWQAEVKRAAKWAEDFQAFLEGLTDEALDELGELGSNIPHLLMHNAYHTGQIMLLRKQQGAWPATRE